MGNTRQLLPSARRDELIIRELPEETLIYDLKSHQAHCLNRTAALVWKYCDGKRTVAQVARQVEERMSVQVSTEVIWLALRQLEKSGLLQDAPPNLTERCVSRREAVRRIGIAAAIALPLVTSIVAPQAVQAASCAGPEEACGGANPPCCDPRAICFNGSCILP